jgi:DNA-binding CsgD family transcriptional regulator/tetratricopeptide (TPR) repeat protein
VFVGRVRELAALEEALEAARGGLGATALISGDAGIGKSRLVAELAARAPGYAVLTGRCLDLVGTELAYQPFAEALGGLPERADAGSQLRVFEAALAALAERAARAPVLLVLEDLHWADASTLDLVVFLAHNLQDRRVLVLGTYRADEPASAERLRRLEDAVGRSGAALALELGPLARGDLSMLLATDDPAVTRAIVARAEGNPFFAQELLCAGVQGELPRGLRDLLLRRVARLDRATQDLLRLVAAAGRDVSYALVRDAAAQPEQCVRESLRRAVEHGVLVADQPSGCFRFRHALLAEAVHATILPGEREALHGRLAEVLARDGGASPAELAPHWAAAGRNAEALSASVEAAAQAEAVFGLAEALSHLERALAVWPTVPDAAQLTGLQEAELCARAAGLADQVGNAPRAVELVRRAIGLVGADDLHRAGLLHVGLGEYLYGTGADEAALAALERAVELVPAEPPSSQRAYVLGSLAGGMMMAWRHEESLALAERAFALARRLDAGEAEVRALTVIGFDLCYLGRGAEGIDHMHHALQLAEDIGDLVGLERAYVNVTDALTMLGRLWEAARLARAGLKTLSRYGVDSALLPANWIEALLATGQWDEADRLSATALRDTTTSFRSWLLVLRAELETARGRFHAAAEHLEAARAAADPDHVLGRYDARVAELALWERRWTDADRTITDGLTRASRREAAQIRVQLCALGLRAQAELAALARARRDAGAQRDRLDRAGELLATARVAAADAASITPNAGAWFALAEAEHTRAHDDARPAPWSDAAAAWQRLERAPLAAYCRWRHSEALVAAGRPRAEAGVPLRDAYAVATRLRARPLLDEIERLATRARLDPAPPPPAPSPALDAPAGLTPRENEVLALLARGLTNREIADQLVISVKTASVHVSHILRKLDASTPQPSPTASRHPRYTPSPSPPVPTSPRPLPSSTRHAGRQRSCFVETRHCRFSRPSRSRIGRTAAPSAPGFGGAQTDARA